MTQPALSANHSNFAFLSEYDPLFLQLAQSAECAFAYLIGQAAQATLNRMNNRTQSILAKAFSRRTDSRLVQLTPS
ncbi:hypothetical protein [Rheinheimera sp.]|uniref:hypothetical protein n=1 Tax=Rheinheimera sp. TaxID=1869214 RepID=UPI002732C9F2|nr:hypothetical protein [Rheinheimera sp.]MDP2713277.1 hypothetical protein [Rheinheimera sp.]